MVKRKNIPHEVIVCLKRHPVDATKKGANDRIVNQKFPSAFIPTSIYGVEALIKGVTGITH